MDTLAALLSSFDVSPLFPIIGQIAKTVGTYLSPVLLMMAIYIRLMETQMDAVVSGGKFGVALKDILVWTFVLGSYFAIGSLVTDFFNPIYTWLDSFGSLKSVMATFAQLAANNAALAKSQSTGQDILGLIASPYLVGAAIFYYGTLVILAFLTAFLKIANVMVFGVAFIWGLVAIPVSISTTFRILRGWAYLAAFALVWPVIQGLLLGMFTMLFTNSVNTMISMSASTPVADNAQIIGANAMMLFSVMHLLMGAVMISAPFIANALVTNTSSAAGIVMPFVGAAIAAGAGVAKATTSTTAGTKNLLQQTSSTSTNTKVNKLSGGPQPRSMSSQPPAGGVSKAGFDPGAGGDEPPTTPAPSAAAPDANKKAQQRRRGVLIRQQAKKPR